MAFARGNFAINGMESPYADKTFKLSSGAESKGKYNNELMAGFALMAGVSGAMAYQAQGDYEAHAADINARYSERSANDAVKRGAKDAQDVNDAASDVQAKQRVALAAQGIEVDSGTAAAVQADTKMQGAMDALTVRNNAYREAAGYKTQAINYRLQGKMSKIAANNQSTATLLTGGLQALSFYNK